MKVTFDKTTMQIDIVEFVNQLDDAAKRELAKALVAEPLVIEAAINAAIEGPSLFEDGEPWWFTSEMNNRIREKLIPILPVATRELVEGLIHQRKQAQADRDRWDEWSRQLYIKWPMSVLCEHCDRRAYVATPPERPGWLPTDWDGIRAETEEKLKSVGHLESPKEIEI